ncbi:hypothetical protein FACS1894216_01080 [Synergistales bacterium]|nr:hypothetical protein FACS1894216_01080 [Synergistales bacterium]
MESEIRQTTEKLYELLAQIGDRGNLERMTESKGRIEISWAKCGEVPREVSF